MSLTNVRYCFNCEYFDQLASLVRTYQLFFYPSDNSIEMFDIKLRKIFLKRVQNPSITIKDLFLGANLTIFNRKMKLVEYGDEFTKKSLSGYRSSTFGMIKPNAYMNIGKIVDRIYEEGFEIAKLKMFRFSRETAEEFYAEHKGKPFFERLITFITSDYCVGLELVGENPVTAWRDLIGPTSLEKAQSEAPYSIRAQFAEDGTKNAVHGSDSDESAARELEFVFGKGSKLRSVPQLTNCACLLIKPHCITEKNAGKVIDIVLACGFEISAMEIFYLDKTYAEEFFEVYNGVLPEYSALIDHVTSGPVIVLEVRQEDVIPQLRALVGPHDPQIGQQIRQKTLRAMFGYDRVKNAVHCTDLPEDGVLESQYFFDLFQNR